MENECVTECPHSPPTVVQGIKLPDHLFCKDCEVNDLESLWVCVSCGNIGCGRYANKHAKSHFVDTNHCMSMNFSGSCHCYSCDAFVIHSHSNIDTLQTQIKKIEEDNDPELAASKAETLTNGGQKDNGAVGLMNLGNTCYINAVVQALSNSSLFREYFLSCASPVPDNKRKRGEDDSSGPAAVAEASRPVTRRQRACAIPSDQISLCKEMKALLSVLWDGSSSHQHSPDTFVSAVKQALPRFGGFQQQDAQEFLALLLDRLHHEISSQPASDTETVIRETFGGKYRSRVVCHTCKLVSVTEDPFFDLSIDIPPRFVVSRSKKAAAPVEPAPERPCLLADCLSYFTSEESLSEDDLYYCPTCKSRQPATKQLGFLRLPPVLCLHLKRFRWDLSTRRKLNTLVEFPLKDLNMAPFYAVAPTTPALYDLICVVNHIGSGAQSGHYTSFCLNEETDEWFQFNDSHVKKIDTKKLSKEKAYILFYRLRE